MHRLFPILGAALVLMAAPAFAQGGAPPKMPDPPRIGLDNSTQGQVDARVSAPGGIQFTAEEGNSRVTLRAGRTRSYADTATTGEKAAYYNTWSGAVSAPLGDGDSSAKAASLEGLASATTIEFKFSRTRAKFVPRRDWATAALAICEKIEGYDPDQDTGCDLSFVVEKAPDQAEAFSRILWGDNVTSFTWGGSAKAGSENFEYIEPTTLARRSTEETSWSATGFVAYYWASSSRDESLITASYTRESSWANRDETPICLPGAPPASCVTGSPGPPVQTDKDIFSIGYRRVVDNMAFSVTANYDSQDDVFGVELPIYLVRGEDGGFTGGVKLDWRSDTDEVVAGIFVSQPFSLLEF